MKRLTDPIRSVKGVRNVEYKVSGTGIHSAHELTVTGGNKKEIAKTINDYRSLGEITAGSHMEEVKNKLGGIHYQIRFNYID